MKNENQTRQTPVSAAALLPGAIVLILGVGFLLGNFGLLRFPVWNLWPLFLVVIGVAKILQGTMPGLIWGAAFTVYGGGLLLDSFVHLPFQGWRLWPVFVVAVGFQLMWAASGRTEARRPAPWTGDVDAWKESLKQSIWQQSHPPGAPAGAYVAEQWMHVAAVFHEEKRRVLSPTVAHIEALAVFGSCLLDLRAMGVPDHPVSIDANAVFGGIEIFIPSTWEVVIKGAGIFGAYQDETLAPVVSEGERGRLIVRGVSVFGGVSVKN